MRRREFLGGAALSLAMSRGAGARETVNDVTQLNPIDVEAVVTPTSIDEISRLVAGTTGPIAVAGALHSQGGQTACDDATVIDTRQLDRIVEIDPPGRRITVEAGATWRRIQEAIDPLDLSVAIMQSYSNFTVGGSLSVNCHGDYAGRGPIVHSVRSLELVLADGSVVTASRRENAELFAAAVGGYGGVGVIVQATLDLEENRALEKVSTRMAVADYPAWHAREVGGESGVVLHHGRLYPPRYDQVNAITSSITDRPVRIADRLAPRRRASGLDMALMGFVADTDAGKFLRQHVYDTLVQDKTVVVWRNYEAAEDADSLEPASRAQTTYVLQEYFTPEARLESFVAAMGRILNAHGVDVVNVAIRHAIADELTLLSWAPEPVYSLVLYYRQATDERARAKVAGWTRELVEAALDHGGRHYLPYQIHATPEQFHRGYPRAGELFALKRRVDPDHKLRNRLWEAYYL